MTRPALADRAPFSRAAAYSFVEELCRAGVLEEAGIGQSTGGRRPQLLRFRPAAWSAIGIEMGERDLRTVLTDLDGKVLDRDVRTAPGLAPEHIADAAALAVERLRKHAPPDRLLGVGFASPGLVDAAGGIVRTAVGYGWTDVPMAALLAERTNLPTFLANRSKAAALGEWHSGAGAGANLLVYVYAGHGAAAGIVAEGELFLGVNSSAGELGHITVVPDGALCECGNRGCLHTLASGWALLARARAALRDAPDSGRLLLARCGGDPARLTTLDLAHAARDGDGLASDLVTEAGRYLGIATATVIDLLNPDRVIVGGPLAGSGAQFVDAVRDEARRRALAVPFGVAQIVQASLGEDAGSIGAAALVLRQAADLIAAATHVAAIK